MCERRCVRCDRERVQQRPVPLSAGFRLRSYAARPCPTLLTSLPSSDIVPGTDKALPENSQPNLNKKLDRAVEETFPSSDPVSVGITMGGAIDYDHDDDEAEDPSIVRSNLGQQGTSESLLTQAKEKLSDVGSTVSEAAHEAYIEGSRYVREAVGQHPEMERYYRQGTEAVRQQASDNPLLTLLVGLGLGYALAWMIHGTASGGARGIPDYARTRRVYARHRDD